MVESGGACDPQEGNFDRSLDRHLLQDDLRKGVQDLIRDRNRVFRTTPALAARDREPEGFRWAVADDRAAEVVLPLLATVCFRYADTETS